MVLLFIFILFLYSVNYYRWLYTYTYNYMDKEDVKVSLLNSESKVFYNLLNSTQEKIKTKTTLLNKEQSEKVLKMHS